MSGRKITLDKQPGVCLVGIRETWRHLFDKFVLKFTGPKATNACQDNHLCAGLKAGTYGDVHGVQDIWDNNLSTENWDDLIVDARNAFNEINCVGIMWTVIHL